jgi:hypothetical protein
VVAAAAARRIDVQIGDTHRESLNLYVAAVASSGERKGPALRAMLAPLLAVEQELVRAAAPVIQKAKELHLQAEMRLRFLRKRAAEVKKKADRSAAAAEALALAQNLPEVSPYPKLIVNNTTPEKLEVILAEQRGSVCMASEEAGAVFEIAAGRYTKDGGAQLDSLLLAYDGGGIDTQRIGRAGVTVSARA